MSPQITAVPFATPRTGYIWTTIGSDFSLAEINQMYRENNDHNKQEQSANQEDSPFTSAEISP